MSQDKRRINFNSAQYQISAQRFDQCPLDTGCEVAFAGRSNAGKSSAINTLTRQKALARTSKTPGRTQLLNFFSLGVGLAPGQPDFYRLVDLPGYGFAKVPESVKLAWGKQISHYLAGRQSLRGVVLVVDSRHPLKVFDQNMLGWCVQAKMPVHILLTKSDKLNRGPAATALLEVQQALRGLSIPVGVQLFSALNKVGIQELEDVISRWFHAGDPQ